MSKRTYRSIQSLLLLLTVFVVGATFYFQYARNLEPCPLCLMQRISAFLFGAFCIMGLCLTTLRRGRLVSILQMFFAFAGLFFASRQLWLQSLPSEQIPACMPGLDTLLRYFPLNEIMHALFWGAGDCAEVDWSFMGLSMAAWALFYFLFCFIASGVIFYRLGKTLHAIH
ncbi:MULTISPECIES: disulfide bond formation protein B [Legionella]|uniref:Disulfide bond formation protein B n=1 Tax=Legionella septentrionalis TaxID=2498109 RepID=A0A433JLX9_9GAMM|nr:MULTISPECIES: disulfide bond formation protein B [Legionella]MCP0913905.1 disulfide bond formation protein B [Legionella sp. 27cVA30]RUQ90429.1 disulfide bond formation protein B [Legionella septentrionalis]RUQ94672.1 disulfide bond formation protein B [Legionella septentrionalis]RUR10775.1 disulfide bond formation protein B [Legionella septentrionalis]RUR16471.1 disulfide bond formation protein B [Legionella septentrionalis]